MLPHRRNERGPTKEAMETNGKQVGKKWGKNGKHYMSFAYVTANKSSMGKHFTFLQASL